jgi:tetratricopeptide (TPR) repeat protein
MKYLMFLFSLLFFSACQNVSDQNYQATGKISCIRSLDNRELCPPAETKVSLQKKDSLLAIALRNYEADPANLENIIWLGRRLAYLWRYQEAIDVFTEGLKRYPYTAEIYRHRGHRFITLRRFDEAIADFTLAAHFAKNLPLTIEPDGIPNRLDQPLSNLHFNIYYHWALAYYLQGELDMARETYHKCMQYSDNPDLKVAVADWLYMTLRRLGKDDEAAALLTGIPAGWEMVENESYHKRILMYKGLVKPEELLDFSKKDVEDQLDLVTQGYGVGNWYLINGDKVRAKEIFKKILETDHWSAFGYIAAEADLTVNAGKWGL